MRIKTVTDENIVFDNGNVISFHHEQDCCEYTYADFSILNPCVIKSNGHWIFIPCYSEQNGWYTSEIDIYYNGKRVLNFDAQFIDG